MFVKLAGTTEYGCVLCCLLVFLMVCVCYVLIWIGKLRFYSVMLKYVEKQIWRLEGERKRSDKLIKQKQELQKRSDKCKEKIGTLYFRWVATVLVMGIAVFFFLSVQRKQFMITEKFSENLVKNSAENTVGFSEYERKDGLVASEYQANLHWDWTKEGCATINREMLENYQEKVKELYPVLANGLEIIEKEEVTESSFLNMKENFKNAVGKKQSDMTFTELWSAFQDGEEICKVYYTSENVFQTAVLAESASTNWDKGSQTLDQRLDAVGGMVGKFEEFVRFQNKDAGNREDEIENSEIAFRKSKQILDAAYQNFEKTEQWKQVHLAVFSYGEIQFAIENLEMTDWNYLSCLYYAGLNCINILPYIEEDMQAESLKKELIEKEIERWNEFEACALETYGEKYWENYHVESGMADELKNMYIELERLLEGDL